MSNKSFCLWRKVMTHKPWSWRGKSTVITTTTTLFLSWFCILSPSFSPWLDLNTHRLTLEVKSMTGISFTCGFVFLTQLSFLCFGILSSLKITAILLSRKQIWWHIKRDACQVTRQRSSKIYRWITQVRRKYWSHSLISTYERHFSWRTNWLTESA